MNRELNDKYVKLLKKYEEDENEIIYHDYEVYHIAADELLCELLKELGYDEVVDAWENVGKWYA